MAEKETGLPEIFAEVEKGKKLMERMERLRRLMGTAQPSVPPQEKKQEVLQEDSFFGTTTGEKIISAAIPFLDQEYQKDLYIAVRLMEMQRVLGSGMLEARSKKEEPPVKRRRKMLSAVRPCLPKGDRECLDTMLKIIDMRQILEQKGEYDGIYLDKTGNTSIGGGTHTPAQRSSREK